MKLLLENWKTYLNEQLVKYQMEVLLRAEPDTQLYGTVFEKIRAIEGITVIKTTESMHTDSQGNKNVKLNIRFMVNPALGTRYLAFLRSKLQTIKDDEGDRIISVKILHMPKEIDI